MKKTIVALSIAAMIGGLGFASAAHATHPYTVYYYYRDDFKYGELAMEYL